MQNVSRCQTPWSAYSSAPSKVAANAQQSLTSLQDTFHPASAASDVQFGMNVSRGKLTTAAVVLAVGALTIDHYATNGSDPTPATAICYHVSNPNAYKTDPNTYAVQISSDSEKTVPVVYAYALNPKDGNTQLSDVHQVVQDAIRQRQEYIDKLNQAEKDKALANVGYKAKSYNSHSIQHLSSKQVVRVTLTAVPRGTFQNDTAPVFNMGANLGKDSIVLENVKLSGSNSAYKIVVEFVPKQNAETAPGKRC